MVKKPLNWNDTLLCLINNVLIMMCPSLGEFRLRKGQSGIHKNYVITKIDLSDLSNFFNDLSEKSLETTNFKLDFHESK